MAVYRTQKQECLNLSIQQQKYGITVAVTAHHPVDIAHQPVVFPCRHYLDLS